MNRRDFLKVVGVSTGAAVAAACDQAVPTKLISKVMPSAKDALPGQAVLVRTTCTECPAGCGVIAKVRDGHPVKLEGDPAHPINRGTLCMRGQAALARLYHPGRLTQPLLNGQPVSWDDAFVRLNSELAKAGPHAWLSGYTDAQLGAMVEDFCAKRGVERLPEFEVYSYATLRKANEIVFGINAVPLYDVKQADVLITVGADVIETFLNPVQFTRDLSDADPRWFHIEPHLSLTGINADERFVVRPGSEAWLLAFLAGELGVNAAQAAEQTGLKLAQIEAVAQALKSAKKPLVIVGGASTNLLAAVLGAVVQQQTNAPLDWGRGLDYSRVGSAADLAKLSERKFGVLFVHAADPVGFNPDFNTTLKNAQFKVGIGDQKNATLLACDLVLPLAHNLETAGALKPLGNTLPATELLAKLGAAAVGERAKPVRPGAGKAKAFLATAKLEPVTSARVLAVQPSIRTFDGRGDSLPLLSEIPDPLTTVTYGAWVTMGQADADNLGVKDRAVVAVRAAGKDWELPVRIMPAQPVGVLTVQRPFLKGVALPLAAETGDELALLPVESVRALNREARLPILSGSMNPENRGIVPHIEDDHHHHEHGDAHLHPPATLYAKHEHKPYRWAMAIDLDKCTGCGACTAACYVENNIAIVGPDEHMAGREMSWIRIEPYANKAGEFEFLPMLCQQCDNAPCEPVCPVLATYHNPDGLNAQVYNRCVGTRYCANNCPYKVRRFGWVDYRPQKPLDLMFNPDVSKRPKGVMEKCTFCVHRITRAKDHAKDEKRLVRDGEMIPACAETCPAQAIVFGNILDESSRVFAQTKSEREYRILEELGTEPAVYYLKAKA